MCELNKKLVCYTTVHTTSAIEQFTLRVHCCKAVCTESLCIQHKKHPTLLLATESNKNNAKKQRIGREKEKQTENHMITDRIVYFDSFNVFFISRE